MAAAKVEESDSFELLVCQVCLENMVHKKPRTLMCNHTFCSGCLALLVKDMKIDCPTCRKGCALPNGDHESLPINFNLQKIEEREKYLVLNCNNLCQNCMSQNNKTNATFKCMECFRLLCDQCREWHNDISAFEEHTVVPLDSNRGQSLKFCDQHSQSVSYMCLECHTLLCTDCIYSKDHDEHKKNVKSIKTGITFAKDCINKECDQISQKLKLLEKKQSETKSDLDKITILKERMEVFLKSHSSITGKVTSVLNSLTNMQEASDEDFISLFLEKRESIEPLLGDVDKQLAAEIAYEDCKPFLLQKEEVELKEKIVELENEKKSQLKQIMYMEEEIDDLYRGRAYFKDELGYEFTISYKINKELQRYFGVIQILMLT